MSFTGHISCSLLEFTFGSYKPLGMRNYEQDFMVTNFVKTNLYSTSLTEYLTQSYFLVLSVGNSCSNLAM